MAAGQRSSRPGPHRLPADVVAFDQRERLMAALATAVYEHGYERTTITDIVTTAAIARPTFYEHFADKDQCFLATFDALEQHVRSLMEAAIEEQAQWPDQVAAGLVAALGFFSDHPEAARICLLDSAALGAAIRPRIDEATERLVSLLELGRTEVESSGEKLLEPIEEPIVTGVLAMLGGRVARGQEDLRPLAAETIESVLGPYIGFAEASAVAARHLPRG